MTTTNMESLLALDSFASEESVRVAVYDRAMKVASVAGSHDATLAAAEGFLVFVGAERWRLDVLDVALRRCSRHSGLETVIAKAEEIAKWVGAEPELTAVKATATVPVKKKSTSKKTGGAKS